MSNWYCIHTKPAKEETVCKLLAEFPAIELLNPRVRRRKKRGVRRIEVMETLFPCYLFARFDLSLYLHIIRNTRGVRRMVGDHSERPWTVDGSIIEFIRHRAENEVFYSDDPKFSRGENVVITDGPLAGLNGIFLYEMSASERVVILLNTIESCARIQLDKAYIARG